MSTEQTQVMYSQTMDRLNRPKEWDVSGIIADTIGDLRRGDDVSSGQVLAIIDVLMFRLREVSDLLQYENEIRCLPSSVAESLNIIKCLIGSSR